MLRLRDYQRKAIDALYEYWANGGGNGLIVLPTGSGKALVIATIIKELVEQYPDMRILNVTHSAELVKQNFLEFVRICPFVDAGIYSASLGRRQTRSQVLFCGIQSVAKRVRNLGQIDLVIVDEAHGISRNANTLYGKFFKEVKLLHPDSRTCGTTATDYRMDSGRLTDDLEDDDMPDPITGEKHRFKLFDDVVYEEGLVDLIDAGYLTRLVSVKTSAKINLKGIATRGGDYVPGQLAAAAEAIIEDAIAEDMSSFAGRKAALFFCASKENARHAAAVVTRYGKKCAVLTSDNSHEQERIFEDFRAGRIWAIASVNMITTGTNFPFVDSISLLISTKSPGKLVQILGRGTRNYNGKTECLVADHGRNLAYHGPIDQISPKAPGKGDGEQPKKTCPTDQTDVDGKTGCGESIPISRMTCHCCGYIFPENKEIKITAQAADAPIISKGAPEPRAVRSRVFRHHAGKGGNPDSVKVSYISGVTTFLEWLCPGHPKNFPREHSERYWRKHGGADPPPSGVLEWLERQSELRPTERILVKPEGKFWRVAGHIVAVDERKVA